MHLTQIFAALITLSSTAIALGPACVGQPNCPDYRCPGPKCPYNVPDGIDYGWDGTFPKSRRHPYNPNRHRYRPSCGGIDGPCYPGRRRHRYPQVSCGGIDGPCPGGRDPYYYPPGQRTHGNNWPKVPKGPCGGPNNPCPLYVTPGLQPYDDGYTTINTNDNDDFWSKVQGTGGGMKEKEEEEK